MHISNLDFIKTSPDQAVQFSYDIAGGQKQILSIAAFAVAGAQGGTLANTITGTYTIALKLF